MDTDNIIVLMRLLEMSDSQFPVGNFSFSNGLETASAIGMVHDAETLKEYVIAAAIQAAYTDSAASLLAYRALGYGDYSRVLAADEQVILCKMNDESRQMLLRMGKKMCELYTYIAGCEVMSRFLSDINSGNTAGTYPIAQAIAMYHSGIPERDMFVSQQYGVVNMILGAALRCVKVSHYDTQKILYELPEFISTEYDIVREMDFEDMHTFVPSMDILASLHEKGNMRMFMN